MKTKHLAEFISAPLLTLLLFLGSTSYLNAQIVNIPDPNFKATLLHHTIDTNGDSEIQVSEAEAYTQIINVGAYVREFYSIGKIADMTGLEAFINITQLQCDDNLLTVLDISQNTKLTTLRCDQNALTVLDLAQNTLLTDVRCDYNALTQLDLSNNPNLESLNCEVNQISNIDITNNLLLSELSCSANELQDLNVVNNINLKELVCSNNLLTDIDISSNILLEWFFCINNQLSSIDVSNNTELRWFYCHINNLTSLDISNNPQLHTFQCQENELTYLDARTGYTHFAVFNATANSNLTCVFVDDVVYMEESWGDYIDEESTFVETQTECDALKTDDILSLQNISIFPNPTKGVITLNFNTVTPNTSYQITINNMIGKKLFKSQTSNLKSRIDITNLPTGIYYLNIQTTNNQSLTHKIIKL